MSYVAIEVEEKKKKQLRGFYYDFMSMEKSEAQAFKSIDEFKKSAIYQDLSAEEKEQFKPPEGKNMIVLIFDDIEECKEFIREARDKGLITQKSFESALSQINEQNQSSHRMGM